MTGADAFDLRSGAGHGVDAVLQSEDDAFLRRTEDVGESMDVKIQAVDACANVAVV
jgi:hypothetical protein